MNTFNQNKCIKLLGGGVWMEAILFTSVSLILNGYSNFLPAWDQDGDTLLLLWLEMKSKDLKLTFDVFQECQP